LGKTSKNNFSKESSLDWEISYIARLLRRKTVSY